MTTPDQTPVSIEQQLANAAAAARLESQRHVRDLEQTVEALRIIIKGVSGPCYCAANENHDGVCRGADCNCHGEPGPRTDDDEPADEDEREELAWRAVCGSLPTWEWWRQFSYQGLADWDTPGELIVVGENPNGGDNIAKTLTAADMLAAADAMPNKTHCNGCDILTDPDDCSSDLILQWAMYGEIVYG